MAALLARGERDYRGDELGADTGGRRAVIVALARTFSYSEELERVGMPGLPAWAPEPAEAEEGFPLRLLGAPGHSQHMSFAGVVALQRQEGEPRCLVNPVDADTRGIMYGDAVEVSNGWGSMRAAGDGSCWKGFGDGIVTAGGLVSVLTGSRLAHMGIREFNSA